MARRPGSGYDFLVAGQDEAQALATLSAMQTRLRDPYDALGLSGSATPADVRTAFLELTKRYHPARFGRMPPDIQRLANEVFLGLRAAHDTLARPTIKPVRQSQSMPVLNARSMTTQPIASGSGARSTSQAAPLARPSPSAAPSAAPVQPLPRIATAPMATSARPPAPPGGQPPVRPSPLPSTLQPRTATAPAAGPRPDDGKELASAIELLGKSQWEQARTVLTGLATRAPQVARYRALLAYARGREAQLQRRVDEARVELEQALQIDPELQLAKTALGELFTRRK